MAIFAKLMGGRIRFKKSNLQILLFYQKDLPKNPFSSIIAEENLIICLPTNSHIACCQALCSGVFLCLLNFVPGGAKPAPWFTKEIDCFYLYTAVLIGHIPSFQSNSFLDKCIDI
jgi:hypothetical protein